MPFKVTVNDSGIDYCCVAKEGKSNSAEKQTGWKNRDINLAGGWFALLYGGEEASGAYADMMIIGHIEKEHLEALKNLPNTAEVLVELAILILNMRLMRFHLQVWLHGEALCLEA